MDTEQELRRQIGTVSDLRGIVRTMKSLAAVNARQYAKVLDSLREYERSVELGFQVALRGMNPGFRPQRPAPPSRLGAVILGSDVGLCGHFNEELVARAIADMNALASVPAAGRRILAVGARVQAGLADQRQPVETTLATPSSPTGLAPTIERILEHLDAWREESVATVLLFHSPSGSPRMTRLLPVDLRQFSRLARTPWPNRTLPQAPLGSERLLPALIRQHLYITLYRTCVESLVAEQQLRLQAMQAAEKNIQDRLEALVFEAQNLRQSTIDAELLDIGAGFEAVTGGGHAKTG